MLTRILFWLGFRAKPLRCRCGAPALVYDAQRGYCLDCYLDLQS